MTIRHLGIDTAHTLALDAQALDGLKANAKKAPGEALGKAAQQFEAMFLNMLLKTMRESLPKDGLLESDTTHTYQSMLDQQWSQQLAKKGVGIADMLVKQLSRQMPADTKSSKETTAANAKIKSNSVQSFVEKLKPYAETASKLTGVPVPIMLGQAGLETGWGRAVAKHADGSSSHNLFGIKAGKSWKGATVEARTTEYVDGKAVKKVERFRAYASYTEAFQDFAKLLRSRYSDALAVSGDVNQYAKNIQRGGYATDPNYAEKLTRAINATLVKQRIA